VNGQAATCDIQPWLSPMSDHMPPDIYAVGYVHSGCRCDVNYHYSPRSEDV